MCIVHCVSQNRYIQTANKLSRDRLIKAIIVQARQATFPRKVLTAIYPPHVYYNTHSGDSVLHFLKKYFFPAGGGSISPVVLFTYLKSIGLRLWKFSDFS